MEAFERWSQVLADLVSVSGDLGTPTAGERERIYELIQSIDSVCRLRLGINYCMPNIDHEIAAISAFEKQPAVIFDVGANVGSWSETALASWPDAKIVAFEPQAVHSDRLSALADRHPEQFVYRPVAVSDKAGRARIHRDTDGSAFASLHKRDLKRHNIPFEDQEEVETVTLADELVAQGLSHIDVLKIDVEGHELAALKGLGDHLANVGLIQFEFGGTMIDSRTFMRDFFDLLEPAGFRIRRITEFGSLDVGGYGERLESFEYANYLAVRAS